MRQHIIELGLERRVGLRGTVVRLEAQDQRHQRFGDVAPAELAEMAARVGTAAQAGLNCCCRHHAALTASMNALIFATDFTPGVSSTPDDTSTSAGCTPRTASPTLPASSPARQAPRPPRIDVAQHPPVEAHPVTARQGRVPRRFGVEQQQPGAACGVDRGGHIGAAGDPGGGPHRQPAARADRGLARGAAAVQLQDVETCNRAVEQLVGGVDENTHPANVAWYPAGERARLFGLKVARRGREEHEADMRRPAADRRVDSFDGAQSADLDAGHRRYVTGWRRSPAPLPPDCWRR